MMASLMLIQLFLMKIGNTKFLYFKEKFVGLQTM